VALGLLDLFLMSPIAINEVLVRLASGEHDKLLLFNAPASALWLLGAHALARRPMRLHLLLMPLGLVVGCDLYLVVIHQTRLSSSSLSVIADNWENARDFVRTHVRQIFLPLGVGLLGYAVAVCQLHGLEFDRRRPRVRALPFVALALLYGGVVVRQVRTLHGLGLGLMDVLSHDRSSPLGVLPQSAIAYLMFRENAAAERIAEGFRFGAHRDATSRDRRVVVLVLGESSRSDHWSLYGYERDTTPKLRARSDLVVFRDVTCQAPLTKLSVPLIITRGDIDHIAQFAHEKSIVAAYHEAGYRTAWFSTQQRDQWTGPINRYTNEADEERFFERRRDGVLVEQLDRVLAESGGASWLVVLHTQGSHYAYADRYPPELRRFPDDAKDAQEALINAYDDSILYTDHVLASVIALLERQGVPAAMLYVADHGENLRDDGDDKLGHFFGNSRDVPVPMVLWTSREWNRADAARAANARENATLQIATTSGFYTVADLGHVTIDGDGEFAARSLLRATYVERPRRFLLPTQEIVDFDQRYPDHHAKTLAPARAPMTLGHD
jgi:heptose-I-phosphate ethanolaminephosphotransferase